jgi:hypothetical protein
LQLEFGDDKEAESFRVKIAQYKTRQDKVCVEVGLFTDADRQRLSFSKQTQLPPLLPILATVSFKEPSVLRQYSVRILPDEGEVSEDG